MWICGDGGSLGLTHSTTAKPVVSPPQVFETFASNLHNALVDLEFDYWDQGPLARLPLCLLLWLFPVMRSLQQRGVDTPSRRPLLTHCWIVFSLVVAYV